MIVRIERFIDRFCFVLMHQRTRASTWRHPLWVIRNCWRYSVPAESPWDYEAT
jgi:hypothetical protein